MENIVMSLTEMHIQIVRMHGALPRGGSGASERQTSLGDAGMPATDLPVKKNK